MDYIRCAIALLRLYLDSFVFPPLQCEHQLAARLAATLGACIEVKVARWLDKSQSNEIYVQVTGAHRSTTVKRSPTVWRSPCVGAQIVALTAQMTTKADKLRGLKAKNVVIRAMKAELQIRVEGTTNNTVPIPPIPMIDDAHNVERTASIALGTDSQMLEQQFHVGEAVWLHKFLSDLEVVPDLDRPITLYCDNNAVVDNSKELRSHKRGKHIERKYHLIGEIVQKGDVTVTKIASQACGGFGGIGFSGSGGGLKGFLVLGFWGFSIDVGGLMAGDWIWLVRLGNWV
ncbi:hypothetical protein LWI29_020975 [Acer saccharum]|uniref:Uncharacterized protein n=1 Tax=Acer saccharum TaxID=4024 RepID=A0AA39S402_ACESA|nr:hypothetical protein LWI29_020975 [Acer saccharum]